MNDLALGAEEVAAKEFPVAFRGFAQHDVRAFLAQVAAELAAARERERLQRERLEVAEERASARALTEEEIEAALGHEAGRVLQAAREAAAEIRSRAEEQVARLVRDASGEGSRAHQEAESVLALRTEEAERIAVEIQAQAQAAAEDVLEEAKSRGREMVAEAQTVRERVLKDLARRRRVAHQQLEQLRAGRERLLDAYRVVRTTLDEATRELSVAEVEARAAAETAVLRMGSPREATVEELEAELVGARDIGLARVSAPAMSVARATRVVPVEAVATTSAPAPVAVDHPTEPEATVDPEPEPEPEPEVTMAPHREPESALPPEPEPSLEPVEHAKPPDEDQGPSRDVEGLFARLRAERAADVSRAQEVLAEEVLAEEVLAEEVLAEEVPPPVATEGAESANGTTPTSATSSAAEPISTTDLAVPAPSDDEDVLQRRDAELEAVQRTLTKALKRALVDEQNEVLDVLRRKGGGVPLVELLPAPSDHTARYLAVVATELRTASVLGAGAGHAAPTVDDLAVGLSAEVADDLRSRLQRALEAADGDVAPLVEAISSAYREWKTTRVEPLARHHLSAAHTRGRFATAPPGKLRWVVDGEEGPCPDCDDNALAGAINRGEAFPTGQYYPPAHVGCRCTIALEPG